MQMTETFQRGGSRLPSPGKLSDNHVVVNRNIVDTKKNYVLD